MKMLLILIIVLSTNIFVFAQCKDNVYNCAAENGGAVYLRDFNTKLKKESKPGAETGSQWSVLLNRGVHYRFNLCSAEGLGKVVLTLYDTQHAEYKNPYGCTFDPITGKDQLYFDFISPKSGMFYVSIRYKPGKGVQKSCAVGILSLVSSRK